MKAKKVLSSACALVALLVGLTSVLPASPLPTPGGSSELATTLQCPGGKPPPCATRRPTPRPTSKATRQRGTSRQPRRTTARKPLTITEVATASNGSYDDVSTGFSVTLDPNAVWSYGYLLPGNAPDPKTFQAFKYHGSGYDFFAVQGLEGIFAWRIPLEPGTPSGRDSGLCVYKNVSPQPISLSPNSPGPSTMLQPGQVSLHPGFGGFFAVIRWRAPKTGIYALIGEFKGLDRKPTTTDVHIYRNAAVLWSDEISDFQRPHQFSSKVSVTTGDSIDFIVGYGRNKNIYGDTTALAARIYPSN